MILKCSAAVWKTDYHRARQEAEKLVRNLLPDPNKNVM